MAVVKSKWGLACDRLAAQKRLSIDRFWGMQGGPGVNITQYVLRSTAIIHETFMVSDYANIRAFWQAVYKYLEAFTR